MPLISTTIDAFSPFIDYQPQEMWRQGGADGDPYASRYEDKTFMLSIDAPGATATFNFTGTEIHVYGAYRCNSGPYSVIMDGTKSEPMRTNGSAPEDVNSQLFQVELFTATDLSLGVHQVVLTNEWSRVPANKSGSAFDIDFITFTSSMSSDDTATIQSEQDEFFSFAPESAWAQVRGSDYNGGSEHLTVQSDTSISFTFAGDRVALYGTYGSDYAIYSAQLDGGPTSIMNASRPIAPLSQQLLFQATGLDTERVHNLTLTSLSQGGAKFAMDYAEVDGASNAMGKAANETGTAASEAGTASEATASAGSETQLSPGSVAGIAAGSIAGVIIFLAAMLLLRRRSRRKNNEQPDMRPATQPGITPYFITTETWRDSNSEVARSSSPWSKSQRSMPSASPSSSKFALRQEASAYSPATSSYDFGRGTAPRTHVLGPDTSHLPPPSYASL